MSDKPLVLDRALTREIRKLLPRPVSKQTQVGSVLFSGGRPGEVIVEVTSESVRVAEFTVRWEGQVPVTVPRWLAAVLWKELPLPLALRLIRDAVRIAGEVRRASFRACRHCRKSRPPEWMHDQTTCQSCAQRLRGVVY